MNDLFLRRGADRRLRNGHLWIYSNEIDSARSPLGSFKAGEPVTLRNAGGSPLGSAYMDPQSLICARLYAPGEQRPMDTAFFIERLHDALALRDAVFDAPCYRLAYGDSDGLPGLVIDRFGEHLVLQLNNAGLEECIDPLRDALLESLSPAGVLLRRDSRARREQGEAGDSEVLHGDVPEQVPLVENGVRFTAPVYSGQKTGWFYDHRRSRARLADWVSGANVLDVYSYLGGWGVQAAHFGAAAVCCLDSSAPALEGVAANAALNGLSDRVETLRGQAPETMAALAAEGRRFDVVVLDPPAFIRRRRELKKGITGYRRINELALGLLNPGGLLVTASCSMHLPRADFIGAVQQAAVRAGCRLQLIDQGGQGPDHPIHPAIPETEYLKTLFLRKVD